MNEPRYLPAKKPKKILKPYRTMAFDMDVVEALRNEQIELEAQFGFRPSYSQVFRHILKLYKEHKATHDKDSQV